MDVLHSKRLKVIEDTHKSLTDNMTIVMGQLANQPDYEKLVKELDDIKGKVASQQVASVFSPKRRG